MQFNLWKQKIPADLHEIDIDIWSKIEFLIEKVNQESVVEATQEDINLSDTPILEEKNEEENIADVDTQDAFSIDMYSEQEAQTDTDIPEYEIKESDLEIDSKLGLDEQSIQEAPHEEVYEEEVIHLSSVAEENIAVFEEQIEHEISEPLEMERTKLELLPMDDQSTMMAQDLALQDPALQDAALSLELPAEEISNSISSSDSAVVLEREIEEKKSSLIHLNHLGENVESLIELAKAFIEAREIASAISLLQSLKEISTSEQKIVIEQLLDTLSSLQEV